MSPTAKPYSLIEKQKYFVTVSKNLKRESERLKTFKNWTVQFLDPKDFARNGLYFTGESDIVRCVFCGVEMGCWESGDDIQADHKKWSESCSFIHGRDCGNIPLSEDTEEIDEGPSYDTCGPFVTEIRPFSEPERGSTDINLNGLWRDLELLGISKTSGPCTPHYSTYENRLKSFETWPLSQVQAPEKLAEAGFYYTKCHDQTVCFHCGGGLKKWQESDDPWVEHAHWFSHCGFINIQKGKDFINEVAATKQPILSAKVITAYRKNCEMKFHRKSRVRRDLHPSWLGVPTDVLEHIMSVFQELCESSKADTLPSTSEKTKSADKAENPEPSCTSPNWKELELCRICYVRERAIVFLPCGHFVSCLRCAPSLSNCPVCRKRYEGTVRAYLS